VHINVSPHDALAAQQVAEKELGERRAFCDNLLCFAGNFV
jgi:hypothetical protein